MAVILTTDDRDEVVVTPNLDTTTPNGYYTGNKSSINTSAEEAQLSSEFYENTTPALKYYVKKTDNIPWDKITGKPYRYMPAEHDHTLSTGTEPGFMSAEDRVFIEHIKKFDFTSKGLVGPKGERGEKGDPFRYEDFTEEQLEALKVKGDTGDTGPQGPEGPRGLRGPQGEKGDKGDKGDKFVFSDLTPEQVDMIRGPKGDKGDTFTFNDLTPEERLMLKGEKGDPLTYEDLTPEQYESMRGPAGPAGPQGEKGDKGDPLKFEDLTEDQIESLRGPQGDPGVMGPRGERGEKGEKGDVMKFTDLLDYQIQALRGPKGDPFKYEDFTEEQLEALRGPEGPQGPEGPRGPKGDTFTWDDLTVQQKAELKGEPMRFEDLTEDQKIALRGEQGPQGKKGDPFTYEDFKPEQLEALRGPKGEQGPAGPALKWDDLTEEEKVALKGEKGDAFTFKDFTARQLETLKGEKGDALTYEMLTPEQKEELRGPQGLNGKSAYELAKVVDPSIGTITEWVASLKGEKGEKGEAGFSAYRSYVEIERAKGTPAENILSEPSWLASLKGETGAPFTYADFTAEQLEGLKGRDGRDFDYNSLSDEQKALVRGPKGDTGESIYQVYIRTVPAGETPLSEEEWLKTLKGEKGDKMTYADLSEEDKAKMKGEKGDKGDRGDKGLSAYELYVKSVPEGEPILTEENWLQSLKMTASQLSPDEVRILQGPSGNDGEPGPSAYEVAKRFAEDNGETIGDIKDWLESLKGKDGEDGKDGKTAYEVAKELDPSIGTAEDWLASLKGKDGKDGKSAYQIAKDLNCTGDANDEQEWILSLQGKNGKDGISAYEVYRELENKKDTPEENILSAEDWLQSLVGVFDYNKIKASIDTETSYEDNDVASANAVKNIVINTNDAISALNTTLSGNISDVDTKVNTEVDNLNASITGVKNTLDTKIGTLPEGETTVVHLVTSLSESAQTAVANLTTKHNEDIASIETQIENNSKSIIDSIGELPESKTVVALISSTEETINNTINSTKTDLETNIEDKVSNIIDNIINGTENPDSVVSKLSNLNEKIDNNISEINETVNGSSANSIKSKLTSLTSTVTDNKEAYDLFAAKVGVENLTPGYTVVSMLNQLSNDVKSLTENGGVGGGDVSTEALETYVNNRLGLAIPADKTVSDYVSAALNKKERDLQEQIDSINTSLGAIGEDTSLVDKVSGIDERVTQTEGQIATLSAKRFDPDPDTTIYVRRIDSSGANEDDFGDGTEANPFIDLTRALAKMNTYSIMGTLTIKVLDSYESIILDQAFDINKPSLIKKLIIDGNGMKVYFRVSNEGTIRDNNSLINIPTTDGYIEIRNIEFWAPEFSDTTVKNIINVKEKNNICFDHVKITSKAASVDSMVNVEKMSNVLFDNCEFNNAAVGDAKSAVSLTAAQNIFISPNFIGEFTASNIVTTYCNENVYE